MFKKGDEIMAVTGVQGSSDYYQNISSGKKINSAADNTAGLSIAEKMTSEINGYDKGTENTQAGQDLLKTAEGALNSIADSLQRMRELTLQSMNATYSDTERGMIQEEIDQLKTGIQDAAKGTEYNQLKLLDGSMADLNLATNPSGGGMKIQMVNATLEALGLEDFDVTSGNFSLETIDNAINKVSESRASIGSASNAMDHVINNNTYASLNLSTSRSNIEDEDIGKAITKKKTNEVLDQYKLFAQQERSKKDEGLVQRLLGK